MKEVKMVKIKYLIITIVIVLVLQLQIILLVRKTDDTRDVLELTIELLLLVDKDRGTK